MSQRVQDLYEEKEFEELLEGARMNAANDWEESFVADMKDAVYRGTSRLNAGLAGWRTKCT